VILFIETIIPFEEEEENRYIAKIEKDERMQLLQGLGTRSTFTTAKVDAAV
jgi:hypothetical protein